MTSITRGAFARRIVVAACACGLLNLAPVSPQVAPGTARRPILSAAEAAQFIQENYFAVKGLVASPTPDPWRPEPIDTSALRPDFVVGPRGAPGATHDSVQKAVNASVALGGTRRIHVKLMAGTYAGAVYVPVTAPPLTIYGDGEPGGVRLELAVDALLLPEAFARTVNGAGEFKDGDPAWSMFAACATLPPTNKIDTACAAVVWTQSDALQLARLTIVNSTPDTAGAPTRQAVALRTDGDRTQLHQVRVIGRQDTLFVNAGEPPTPSNRAGAYATDRIARVSVTDSYIEGDTDFVFGRARTVFDRCEFKAVSTRRSDGAVVFAPDTVPASSYGFLVVNSRMTGDEGFVGTGKVRLGRSWDQGASATGYIAGRTPNGQLVIRNTYIDSSFSADAPWGSAATTNRPHAGNANPGRDLNDGNFNRLWEYDNHGPGAGGAR